MLSTSKKNDQPRAMETLIGENTVFQGIIKSDNSVRIDGRLEGSVQQADQVVVGAKGSVQGDINARTIIIGGKIAGNLTASGHLTLEEGSQVVGDMCTPQLEIGNGAVFEGHCVMLTDRRETDTPADR